MTGQLDSVLISGQCHERVKDSLLPFPLTRGDLQRLDCCWLWYLLTGSSASSLPLAPAEGKVAALNVAGTVVGRIQGVLYTVRVSGSRAAALFGECVYV